MKGHLREWRILIGPEITKGGREERYGGGTAEEWNDKVECRGKENDRERGRKRSKEGGSKE